MSCKVTLVVHGLGDAMFCLFFSVQGDHVQWKEDVSDSLTGYFTSQSFVHLSLHWLWMNGRDSSEIYWVTYII